MGSDQVPEWVKMLDGGMIGKDIPGVGLLYAVSIKVEFSGVLAIMRAKGGGGHLVGFVGAKNLRKLAEKIRPVLTGEEGRWREDEYA